MMTVWMGCGDEDTTDPAQLGQGTLDSGSSPQEDSGSSDTTILTSGPDTALDSGMALDDVPPDMDLEDTDPPPADTDQMDSAAMDSGVVDSAMQDTDPIEPDVVEDTGMDPNAGWIGGPCQSAAACDYDDAICLADASGYPGGACSQFCDRFCPDREGNSVTFCVEGERGGQCMSRCDSERYPDTGCRQGYRCQFMPRYNEPSVTQSTCVPESWPPPPPPDNVSDCLQELTMRGVVWDTWGYTTQSASGQQCTISDPIRVQSPINGVSYRYVSHDYYRTLSMSCELALALYDLGDLLREYDIVEVIDIGTFNCRTISGTSRLSQHSFGTAIDIYGFTASDGTDYILERDWEHDTDEPVAENARVLYTIAQRMYDEHIFNIILTPNYNAGHDNHFHVDLTAGSHVIRSGFAPERYIGPDRWERCGND
ncbi:MAG: extensin family protein [Myxococcota bacterium]